MQIGSQNSASTSICGLFLPPASPLEPLSSPKLSIEQENLQNRSLRGFSSNALAFKPISQPGNWEKKKTFESHYCFCCSVLVKVSVDLTQALMVPSAPSPPHREIAWHIHKRKKKSSLVRWSLSLSEVLDSNNMDPSCCYGNISGFESNLANTFYINCEANTE